MRADDIFDLEAMARINAELDEPSRPMRPTDQSIRPALTPEEWRDGDGYGRIARMASLEASLMDWTKSPSVRARGIRVHCDYDHDFWGDDLPALMALANDALPNDDPRKITRADVEALRGDIAELADRGGGDARSLHLLGKLAALLPPE